MRGGSDTCVNDDGDGGLGDDDGDLISGGDAFVRADGCAEGHDGGAADILEAFGEDGVGVDVGEDGEAFLDEDFGGFEGFDGVGEEVGGIGVDFEFYPFREAGGVGESGEADGFLGVHGAAGVGEEEIFIGIDEVEDVGKGIVFSGEVGAAEGDGYDLGSGGFEGVFHGLVGREFSGSEEEA